MSSPNEENLITHIPRVGYNRLLKVSVNSIDHSSAKGVGEGGKPVCLAASSVCIGIVNDVPSHVWGNLTLKS